MRFSNISKLAVAAAALACVGSVSAVPISVGFNFIPFGGTLTGNNGDITTSTSVTYAGGSYLVNAVDNTATTNNIGVALSDVINLTNPMPLTIGSVFEKRFTADEGDFLETLTVDSLTIGGSSRAITATGTITCVASCGATFDPTTVYFSASYTQNGGPTGQVNASFNNSTVPPPRLPEPASLALLGLGMAGLSIARRRRG